MERMTNVENNDRERLAALREYRIPDTKSLKEFEDLTLLASEICKTPISLVTLMDGEKERIKAGTNLPVREISRDMGFCSYAAGHPSDPFIIADLHKDKRFADHPFVKGEPHIVFYAGIPLTNPDGYVLGTLCVLDKKPRTLSEKQIRSLQILAKQVTRLLELRKANIRLEALKKDLVSRSEELQQFAYVVSHDIKSPLSSIVLSGEMLRENFGERIDDESDQLLHVLNRASFKIKNLVDGVLAFYRAEQAMKEGAENFLLKPFLLSIEEMLRVRQAADIVIPQDERRIFMNKTALEQILVNLLQNALKYNDNPNPKVIIRFSEDDANYYFIVTDNGRGISAKEQEKISGLFTGSGGPDRFGTQGLGIGLTIVQKLVEKMSGKIKLKSIPGEGSEFSFYIKKQN
jgi:signal transduction histidine kinase